MNTNMESEHSLRCIAGRALLEVYMAVERDGTIPHTYH
jgi:hypothetical protein